MIVYSIKDLVELEAPKLPVVIPTFNNPTYMCNMIEQLVSCGFDYEDIIILDNFSRSTIMQEMLSAAGAWGCIVVKKFTNDGPREYYLNKTLFNWLPEKFIITDPDIEFNENLPKNFVSELIRISEIHQLYKVGFALDIEMVGIESNIKQINFNPILSMYEWEKQFWQDEIDKLDDGSQIYRAAIDTTFCLVNKKYFTNYQEPMQIEYKCARIGGSFTAQHYGWYTNPPVTEYEYEYYLSQVLPQWSFTSNAIKQRKGI